VVIVDANVLLYAVDRTSAHHEPARSWLDGSLGGAHAVGLAWFALLAFIRIGTKASIVPSPHDGPGGDSGNLTTDADLAALAVEHGADIVSYDRDFARFPGITHHLPGYRRAPPRVPTSTAPPRRPGCGA
jgi:predicted nucleic acid-binding protein